MRFPSRLRFLSHFLHARSERFGFVLSPRLIFTLGWSVSTCVLSRSLGSPLLFIYMAGYDDPAEELYYMDDTAGSFDQDLVYALDAGVRHSVNQALAQAIQPIKHHLLGLVDQKAWAAPVSTSTMEDPSFAAIPQTEKQLSNPHAADFQSLIRNMAREHDYNAGAHKKGKGNYEK
ncbi:hypothetical protein NDU88_003605 [Pleurodeles waltl]|uniref:Uncharacterized protein n=1 Tax=Pleurodeles waltl TaxID=8319 RepID=A0AAV7LHE8_PLEWA|nr:hypothetical protein NDU88_003605 [Pleurodeles waltl]